MEGDAGESGREVQVQANVRLYSDWIPKVRYKHMRGSRCADQERIVLAQILGGRGLIGDQICLF